MMRVLGFIGSLSIASTAFSQAILPTLFAGNNVGDNITSFRVNPDGSLTTIGSFAAGDGPQTISLSPDGKWLAVGHGTASVTTEELRIFQVNADGTLTPRLTTLVPDSPLDVLWTSNSNLCVTKTGSPSNVQSFIWDPGANTLTSVDTEPTGSFNSFLLSDGSHLWANDSTGSTIRAFSVAPNGLLALVEAQPTNPYFAVALGLTRDNRFMYGAGGISGDGNRILGYRVNPDGSLDPTSPTDFTSPGESPKNFAFSENGLYAFVGHGTDATIQTFTINSVTGELTATGASYDVGLQGTLGEIVVMGNMLYACDNSTAIDGRAGVIALRINGDGSLTELNLFPSGGARTDYLAAWPGIPEPGTALPLAALLGIAARRLRGAR